MRGIRNLSFGGCLLGVVGGLFTGLQILWSSGPGKVNETLMKAFVTSLLVLFFSLILLSAVAHYRGNARP